MRQFCNGGNGPKGLIPFTTGRVAVAAIGVLILGLVTASSGMTFECRYGVPESAEAATDIIESPDGSFLVVGTVFDSSAILWLSNMDGLVMKIDSAGAPVWTRRYGNTSWVDAITSAVADGDEFVMTGIKNDDLYGGQVWFLKIDQDGDVLAERCYGGDRFKVDMGSGVIPVRSQGYFIVGTTKSFTPDQKGDVWLLRLDEQGDTIWTRTYNLGNDDGGTSIASLPDGRFIITVNTCTGYRGGVPLGFATCLIVDSAGNVVDSTVFRLGEHTTLAEVSATRDGGAILTGASSLWSNFPNRQVLIAKLAPAGETLWTRLYGATNRYNGGFDIIERADRGYYVAAYSQTYQTPEMDFDNWWLLRLDANGDTVWTRWWGGPKNDDPLAICPVVDGGIILAGLRDGNSNWFQSLRIGNMDIYVIKTDSTGAVSIAEPNAGLPPLVGLKPSHPNPFSNKTTISFVVRQRCQIELRVVAVSGREVARFVSEELPAGEHDIVLDASGLPSGTYFCFLKSGDCRQQRKLTVVR